MQLRKGMKVSCRIGEVVVKEAVVQEEDGEFYLCQNEKRGASCENKLGYIYSWGVGNGDEKDQRIDGVFDVKLLSPLTLDDIYTGCVIKDGCGERKILARVDDVVLVSCDKRFDTASRWWTIQELKDSDFKVISPVSEEGDEVEKAIKLLQDRGKIKDGKIVVE